MRDENSKKTKVWKMSANLPSNPPFLHFCSAIVYPVVVLVGEAFMAQNVGQEVVQYQE